MIYLVRHGQTDQNKKLRIQGQSDFPLNEYGLMQAKKTGEFIKNNYKIDYIISSPLTRAIETAEQIKRVINYKKEIIIENGFIERCFGEAEGMDISDDVFKKIENNNIIGLESPKDLQLRVYNTLIKVFNEYKDKNILVTTHSHTIKAILTYLDSNRTFRDKLDNCAINIFDYKNGKIEIIESNINPLK